MIDSVAAEDVDTAVQSVVLLAVEHLIQERCTHSEAMLVRAALSSPLVARHVDEAESMVIAALMHTLPDVLNAALYPEDECDG